jgi:hypothetical protein
MTSEIQDIAKDLASQVFEAWQRGTLNTNLIRLSIRGQLSPRQVGEFKSGVEHTVREVKGLKERLFEPGKIVFEVDFAGDASQVGDRLKALKLPELDTKLAEVNDKEITMDVRGSHGM